MKRKILALLLVLTLAVSIAPLAAYADCAHPKFYDYSDTDVHGRFCTECGEDIIPLEEHYDNDGDGYCDSCNRKIIDNHDCTFDEKCKCTICGRVEHSGSITMVDEATHEFVCNKCGFTDPEPHDKNNSGACVCGYGCTHQNAHYDFNQYGHAKYCDICYKALIQWTEHTVPCAECGYTPCADGQHEFGLDGWEKHTCQKCSYLTDCEDANGDCVCDICGNETHDVISVSWNATHHWYACSNCGKEVYKYTHFDDDKDGLCDGCECSMSNPGSGTTTFDEAPVIPNAPEAPAADTNGLDNVPKTGDVTIPFLAAGLLLLGSIMVLPLKKRGC